MNLTKRTKWLTGIAALIAAYVVFGPKDGDSVEPAHTSAGASRAHTPRDAAPAAPPIAGALAQLAHRVVQQTVASSLFAAHSWYVPPPAPPPAPVLAPPPPPKPVAPPLPFAYMGSYAPQGTAPVFFLTQGDRVYSVHIGDTLDNTYSVDSFADGQLTFTYKPLNQQQQLMTGGAP
jgi:hypothetical protein